MMKIVANAVYLLIFLQFLRKLFLKCSIPFTVDPVVEHLDDSDEYFVLVNNMPFFWCGSIGEAREFIWHACSMSKSLANKFKIQEYGKEYVLFGAEDIPGLTEEEILSLNMSVDALE